MCRESPTLSPNLVIILIRLVVDNPLVFEDGYYFLGKALGLQSSPPFTIQSGSLLAGGNNVGGMPDRWYPNSAKLVELGCREL